MQTAAEGLIYGLLALIYDTRHADRLQLCK